MAKERYDPGNPLHIELSANDGKFIGYYDCERDLLLLFSRGDVIKYPLLKMIEQVKKLYLQNSSRVESESR